MGKSSKSNILAASEELVIQSLTSMRDAPIDFFGLDKVSLDSGVRVENIENIVNTIGVENVENVVNIIGVENEENVVCVIKAENEENVVYVVEAENEENVICDVVVENEGVGVDM